MTRQQYLWLFIWIFIFFLLFCIWDKTRHYSPKTPIEEPKTALTDKVKKEIYFKVIKEQNRAILSGIVSNEDAKNRLLDAYGKVFDMVDASALRIDKEVKEDGLVDFFANFADNFSHFEVGYLAFANGNLEVDGIAKNAITKQTLQEQLATLKNIKIDNRLFIKAAPKPLPQERNSTKRVTQPKKSAAEIQKELDDLLRTKRVQFLYARDILTSGSKLLIDKIATLLKANDTVKIEIAGHTDSDGSKERNLKLSKRRAESVKEYLITQGIAKERLKAVGYGESHPLLPNTTQENRALNRRVEFKVIGESS